MSRPIRVLVVDDSAVARRLVQDALAEEGIVVETAPNGVLALHRIRAKAPDVVTLDVEMPEMDGTATLRAIRSEFPHLPVVMVSSLTSRGAAATVEYLLAGANDCVEKPTASSREEAVLRMRLELTPRVLALAAKAASLPPSASKAPATPPPREAPLAVRRPPALLAIGSSTGGPAALASIFSALPRALPVPIVIAQHMPPMFTEMLAQRLSALSPMVVREGVEGAVLRPGEAWIAPGGYHMVVRRKGAQAYLGLSQEPPVNSCRPAVDVLFGSIARAGIDAVALILTGMGRDGSDGGRAIRDAGGRVIVQDQASSVVWGMPGAAVGDGVAQQVLALDEIAPEIVRLTTPMHSPARIGAPS